MKMTDLKTHLADRNEEERLFKIAKRCLNWAEFTEYTEEELSDLVMLELINIR